MKHLRLVVLGSYAVVLMLAIWWPLDWSIPEITELADRALRFGVALSPGWRDVVTNVVIFIPLGMILHPNILSRWWAVGAVAAVLSAMLEVGQLLQPERIVSLVDVIFNTVGAFVGVFLKALGGRAIRTVVGARIHPLGIAALAVLVVIPTVAWLQDRFASLREWSGTYPLQLGNEATGNRPWCGEVLSLRMTVGGKSWTKETLHLEPGTATRRSNDGCPGRQWFQAVEPPRDLVNEVLRAGQLTLVMRVSADLDEQYGPARILSNSADPGRRNFTVGQDGQDLILRVRRRWGGANGARPSYRLRRIFQSNRLVTVAIQVDSDSTVIRVAGQSLVDRHDVVRQWWFLLTPGFEWTSGAVEAPFSAVFWLITLGPFGCLIGAASARRPLSWRWNAATCVLVGVVCWIALRSIGVWINWESAGLMPATLLVAGELTRRRHE